MQPFDVLKFEKSKGVNIRFHFHSFPKMTILMVPRFRTSQPGAPPPRVVSSLSLRARARELDQGIRLLVLSIGKSPISMVHFPAMLDDTGG